jgi:hypothetical protein
VYGASTPELPRAHGHAQEGGDEMDSASTPRCFITGAGSQNYKPLPKIPTPVTEAGNMDLKDILMLFDTGSGVPSPKCGLRQDEVNSVMRKLVATSSGEEATARWLITQLKSIVSSFHPDAISMLHLTASLARNMVQ